MGPKRHFMELDETAIMKLPFVGPLSRRIYATLDKDGTPITTELFIQKPDAFTTSLIGLINRLKSREISEIRYLCGYDGLVRIFLNEKGKPIGEYSCESMKSLENLKDSLQISRGRCVRTDKTMQL
jgi:hypothetical protein